MKKAESEEYKMKLKDLLKVVDPIVDVDIWTQYDDEESGPSFSGSMLDIPWVYLNYKIGLPKGKEKGELPVYIATHTNKRGVELPCMIINLIDK